MKALVVYESMFGNTEVVARAVAERLGKVFEVTLADVRAMPPAQHLDLVVVGAPTHVRGLSRPSTRAGAARTGTIRPGADEIGLREYLDVSPMLTGIAAAAFDTRVAGPRAGSAARKAHRQLRRLGCRVVTAPASFVVEDTTGPLADGERERAGRWADHLAALLVTDRHLV